MGSLSSWAHAAADCLITKRRARKCNNMALRSSGTVESEHPYQPNEMCYYEISPNSTNVRVKFTKVSYKSFLFKWF